MKMILPSKKDVQYIRCKLRVWHEANKNQNGYPDREKKEFRRALTRLSNFFHVPLPKVEFYEKLPKALGRCTLTGTLQLLTPHDHKGSYVTWSKTFFHEFGHYIYYANAEKKANEFERRMMDRW